METLIIYDNSGYIYMQMSGTYTLPEGGIQYLETEIPEGKIATKVDVLVTPNVAILEDKPKSELELANERIEALENYVLEKETDNAINSL